MVQVIEKYNILRSLDTNEQVRKMANFPTCETSIGGISVKKGLLPKVGRMVYKQNMISPLLDYAKKINSPNLQQYWAVLKCGTILTQSDNQYLKQDYYCGSRLCPNCSNIRSQKVADIILATIDVKLDWCSLTLTKSNKGLDYSIDNLKIRLNDEQNWFNRKRDVFRKRGGNFSAIISLEIIPPVYKNNNNGRYYADYHPHYHILCTYEFACFLRQEWLNDYSKSANYKNQVISKVSDLMIKKPELTKTGALLKTIKEVVKYSLKTTLPKEKSSYNVSVLNLEGVDGLVSLLKGRKRFKRWGSFLKKDKEINDIENKEISKLDLQKVSYNDLPIKDTGDMVEQVDYKGNIKTIIPEYKKDVKWIYNHEYQDYIYYDDWGRLYLLTHRKKTRKIIELYEGRVLVEVRSV